MDPADDEMRKQMFKSLVALEKMCDTVTDHLTADKRPPEQNEPEPAADVDEAIKKLRMRVAGGATCDHAHIQTQCKVCAKWLETEPALESPKAPTGAKLEGLGMVVAKHHKALALLATFGMMKDKPSYGPEPDIELATLLGMRACRNCVGTGRVDRDDTCSVCDGAGFLTA